MVQIHVATLNIRNLADRWPERLPLPLADMAALRPARLLVDWLEAVPVATVQVAMGDFNAVPQEPAAERMRAAGFRSALAEANGSDPAVTWPSGIQAAGMDTDGAPSCLDYIWVRGPVRVRSARVTFDRPHPDDPTLYPSDHFRLSATLEIAPGGPPEDR